MWEKIVAFLVLCLFTYVSKQLRSPEPNKIKFNFNFFIFYFVTSVIASVIWPIFLLSPKNVRNSKIGAMFCKHITKLYDLKWVLRNRHILEAKAGAVIVSNHQSSLDILGMFNIWEIVDKLAAVAKKELFYVWPFGLSAYLAGVVFIDRTNPKTAYKQLKVISDVLVKEKTKLWIFPEGTRNRKFTTPLQPFKKGAFNIAVAAQVPVIPVVFSPYYFIDEKKYIFNKGHVIIHCLEPIPTEGLTADDVPALIERTHDLMEKKYKELSKEVSSELAPNYPHNAMG